MEHASIWRYGNLELHFADDRLCMIFCDYVDTLDGGPSLAIDPWILARPGLTLLAVMSALNREHIDFTKTTRALGARPHAYVKSRRHSHVAIAIPSSARSRTRWRRRVRGLPRASTIMMVNRARWTPAFWC